MLRLTNEEAKKLGISGSKRSTIRKDNSTDEVYKQAIQTIHDIQGFMHDMLFRGDIKLKIIITGKTKADIDNIFKGVADSLQGLIYENDKQIIKGSFECRGKIWYWGTNGLHEHIC